jgi:hypothetical protein
MIYPLLLGALSAGLLNAVSNKMSEVSKSNRTIVERGKFNTPNTGPVTFLVYYRYFYQTK